MKLKAPYGLVYIPSRANLWYAGETIEVPDENVEEIAEYRLANFTPVDDEGNPLDLPPVVVTRVQEVVGKATADGFFDTDSLNEGTVDRVLTASRPRR